MITEVTRPIRRRGGTAVRRAWPWLRLLVGVGIIAALVWRLGSGAFLDGLRVIDVPSVLAALGIAFLTTVCCAARWCVVARGVGMTLSLRSAIAHYYRSQFVNVVLPTGVLGDVQRAVGHGEEEGDVGRGVRAVVLERTGGQIVLFAIAAVVLVARPEVTASVWHDIVTSPAGVVVLCLLAALAAAFGVSAMRWGRGTSRWRRAVTTTVTDIRRGLLTWRTWPAVVALSVVVVLGHVGLFLVAAHTAGSPGTIGWLVPPLVLTLLASGLPVNVGGWGPRESVAALSFQAAGLGATQGLTVAVVFGVLTFVSTLPGAVLLVTRRRRPRAPEIKLEQRVLTEDKAA
jgi:uncharacterized membrane protein YbhN (UPF0104 family)